MASISHLQLTKAEHILLSNDTQTHRTSAFSSRKKHTAGNQYELAVHPNSASKAYTYTYQCRTHWCGADISATSSTLLPTQLGYGKNVQLQRLITACQLQTFYFIHHDLSSYAISTRPCTLAAE